MTTDELPAPIIPSGADLRDFEYMPLRVQRLRDSELSAEPDAEAFRANVISWCVSWHQVPAGSLPNDDGALARLLGYGRDLKTWKKVRENGGLRHWALHSDGRLYHHLVAEEVLGAWLEKLRQRKLSAAGNAKRHGFPFDPTEADAAINEAADLLATINPQSKYLLKAARKNAPSGNENNSQREKKTVPAGEKNGPIELPLGSQDKGREDKGKGNKDAAAVATGANAPARTLEQQVFDLGKEVLGKSAGGMISNLRKALAFDDGQCLERMREAQQKSNPREWISKLISNASRLQFGTQQDDAAIYQGVK